MTRKAGRIMLFAAALCLSGCGQRVQEQTETEKRETQAATESVILSTEPETEAPTESAPQKLITSVDYTSKDGSVKITLPDNTWKVTQDADEMRVFQSGNDAIINIVHADNQTAMKSLTVMTSREDLEASLSKQYQEENAYEIEDFTAATKENIQVCRYTVKYNAAARMWAYAVTNAVIDGEDEAYVVTGTVTDDNKTLLEAVKTSVASFRVLNNETLRKVTGEVITGTPQVTNEEVKTGTLSAEELESLVEYGSSSPLVTNDSVNVRLTPGTDGGVLTTLDKGATVTVTGETDNWFRVDINGNAGYIRKDFLVYPQNADTAEKPDQNAEAAQNGSSSTMTASADVNIRTAPGTDSEVIGSLGAGQSVTVIGEQDGWVIVSVNGQTGYVAKDYLSASGSSQNTAQTGDVENTGESTQNGPASDRSSTFVGGTVISSSVDTITIQTDSGEVKTVYYGDAAVSASSGIYDGVYVEIVYDPSMSGGDGTINAQNITGY